MLLYYYAAEREMRYLYAISLLYCGIAAAPWRRGFCRCSLLRREQPSHIVSRHFTFADYAPCFTAMILSMFSFASADSADNASTLPRQFASKILLLLIATLIICRR